MQYFIIKTLPPGQKDRRILGRTLRSWTVWGEKLLEYDSERNSQGPGSQQYWAACICGPRRKPLLCLPGSSLLSMLSWCPNWLIESVRKRKMKLDYWHPRWKPEHWVANLVSMCRHNLYALEHQVGKPLGRADTERSASIPLVCSRASPQTEQSKMWQNKTKECVLSTFVCFLAEKMEGLLTSVRIWPRSNQATSTTHFICETGNKDLPLLKKMAKRFFHEV